MILRQLVFGLGVALCVISSVVSARAQSSSDPPSTQQVPAPAPINPLTGPSFPCPQPEDPLAQLVCSTPTLALLDMQFVQTYEALYQQVGALGDPTLREQDIQFDMAVRTKCGIALSQASNPSATPPRPAPAGSDQCVGPAYQQQIALWKSILLGSAAEEANRSIQDQVALQTRLQTLGFLPPQAQIDGVFGVGTRAAIMKWQASIGRQQTGLLGNADAQALLPDNTPDSTPGAASPPNAGQQPPKNTSSASNDQPPASALTFSDPEGIAYANLGETTWTINSSYNEMTDQTDRSVVSTQTNDTGVTAQVTGTCSNSIITFSALIADDSGQTTVNLLNESSDHWNFFLGGVGDVLGYLRINSMSQIQHQFLIVRYGNEPQIAKLSVGGISPDAPNANEPGFVGPLDLAKIWRILAELDTDHGSIIIKIPLYDPQIEGFAQACVATSKMSATSSNIEDLGVAASGDSSETGALIDSVEPGSLASTAGLQPGDVITQINGQTVTNPLDIHKDIGNLSAGENAVIDFLRGDQNQEITVVVGSTGNIQTH